MIVHFKGTPVHTSGALPALGSQAPDFSLVGTDLKSYTLSDFPKHPILIVVVPSLDTPLCLLSAKKFNAFLAAHPKIVGLSISADLPFAQKRACSQEHLDNLKTLSTFRAPDFGSSYGLFLKDGPLAGCCARSVIALDAQRRVIYVELAKEITQELDYEKAFQALLSLQDSQ